MFRFRVRKIPGPLLKFTQKAVLFQDISIFFVLKTELYLSSGTYFFFWKLVFHFTEKFTLHYIQPVQPFSPLLICLFSSAALLFSRHVYKKNVVN